MHNGEQDLAKTLDWDYEANTTIGLKDEKNWRRVVLLVLTATMVVTIVLLLKSILGI